MKVKIDQSKPYTRILNERLQAEMVSSAARAVYCLLRSMPEDWKYNANWVQKQFPDIGRDKLKNIIKELKGLGWVEISPVRDKKGKIVKWDWIIH